MERLINKELMSADGVGVSPGIFGKVQGPVSRFNELGGGQVFIGNHGAQAETDRDMV